MIINFQENSEDNEMLNEIKKKLGEEDYNKIIADIDLKCKHIKEGSAISLISAYTSDWTNTEMQKVYNVLEDENEAALYAGVIFKEAIRKTKFGNFEICKNKNGTNLYYKR